MENKKISILEFDEDKSAILNPQEMNIGDKKITKYCILCFFNDVLKILEESGEIKKVLELNSTLGKHKIYEMNLGEITINVFNPGLGGPMAGGFLEELIGLGVENFIACGGAGVLDSNIKMGELILPISAIRDEGTSYHYLPPNADIFVKQDVIESIKEVLEENKISFIEGKTWTTDAIYRETRTKAQNRKKEGCVCVEMEFATMLAISIFRGINFGQILYGGDCLDGDIWQYRNWRENESIQMKMFWICADILKKIKNKQEE